jgi:hypothetical protein
VRSTWVVAPKLRDDRRGNPLWPLAGTARRLGGLWSSWTAPAPWQRCAASTCSRTTEDLCPSLTPVPSASSAEDDRRPTLLNALPSGVTGERRTAAASPPGTTGVRTRWQLADPNCCERGQLRLTSRAVGASHELHMSTSGCHGSGPLIRVRRRPVDVPPAKSIRGILAQPQSTRSSEEPSRTTDHLRSMPLASRCLHRCQAVAV